MQRKFEGGMCACSGIGEPSLFLEIIIWQVWLSITATGEHMHGSRCLVEWVAHKQSYVTSTFFFHKYAHCEGIANVQLVRTEQFNGGYSDSKLFIANSLSLVCIPKCLLRSRALHYLAGSVNWDEKVLRYDNAPTYFSTQINMYKQMACIHACTPTGMHTHTCKCTMCTHSHARRPLKLS